MMNNGWETPIWRHCIVDNGYGKKRLISSKCNLWHWKLALSTYCAFSQPYRMHPYDTLNKKTYVCNTINAYTLYYTNFMVVINHPSRHTILMKRPALDLSYMAAWTPGKRFRSSPIPANLTARSRVTDGLVFLHQCNSSANNSWNSWLINVNNSHSW